MEDVSVSNLKEGPYKKALYHSSGEKLFPHDSWLQQNDIDSLKKAGIKHLTALGPFDDRKAFTLKQAYKETSLLSLIMGEIIPDSVYTKEGKLLLTAGITITNSIIARLKQRSIENIYTKKKNLGAQKRQIQLYRSLLIARKQRTKDKPAVITFSAEQLAPSKSVTRDTIDGFLNESNFTIEKQGTPFHTHILETDPYIKRSETIKNYFIATHQQSLVAIRGVFHSITEGKSVPPSVLEGIIGGIISSLIKDRELLCNLSHIDFAEEDYLFNHSLNVMIFSIHIGVELGYNKEQMLELGHGALLADIGMVKVPDDILYKPQKLTTRERLLVQQHPVHSLELLHHISHLPYTTPFIAYQAHERHDGKGYPRKRKSQTIHDYAKIVAIADIYDALTSNRPYRKKLSPYRAMEGVLRICNTRSIDEKFLRAFINASSIFPLGSYVLLEGNRLAKVIATTTNMTQPIVRLLIDAGKNVDSIITINLTQPNTPQVIRGIDKQHLPDHCGSMFGF